MCPSCMRKSSYQKTGICLHLPLYFLKDMSMHTHNHAFKISELSECLLSLILWVLEAGAFPVAIRKDNPRLTGSGHPEGSWFCSSSTSSSPMILGKFTGLSGFACAAYLRCPSLLPSSGLPPTDDADAGTLARHSAPHKVQEQENNFEAVFTIHTHFFLQSTV